ncbi:MAG TPA: rod shape-determining protein MreC [Candidatus Paceibacterota bacterium]
MKHRDPRGIIITLIIILFVGVFQLLPRGLLFVERAGEAPLIQKEDNNDIPDDVVLASVLLNPGFVFSDTMLLAAGVEQRVRQGDIVASLDGVAIGTVVSVQNTWSKTELLSRLGNVVVLRAGSEKEITFEARGIGGGELRVDLPSALELRAGDIIWLGSNPAYIAGFIDTVDRAPGRQLQHLIIRVPVAPERLHRVLIVHPASHS